MLQPRLLLILSCALLILTSCASTAGQADDDEERYRCPEGREIDTFCSNIVRWARDPDTGHCCRYESQCATPTGWKTYPSEAACKAAAAEE